MPVNGKKGSPKKAEAKKTAPKKAEVKKPAAAPKKASEAPVRRGTMKSESAGGGEEE